MNLDQYEANVLYVAMMTDNWHFTKLAPCDWFSNEMNANFAYQWEVVRVSAPYRDANGKRAWTGESPSDALNNALSGLACDGFIVEDELKEILKKCK